MNEIKGFYGKYRFLSNFYICPVHYNGIDYTNTEAAFQAQKVMDYDEWVKFSQMEPREAKRYGYTVKLRDNWEVLKMQFMYEVICNKFFNNPELEKLLLDTGDAYLEETNTWHDNEWGACYCEKCKDKPKRNLLGKILMRVREDLNP